MSKKRFETVSHAFPTQDSGLYVPNVYSYIQSFPHPPFHTKVWIDRQQHMVYKTKNKYSPKAVLQEYDQLAVSGILVGERPHFLFDHKGAVAEAACYLSDINGADYLAKATPTEGVTFYKDVLLTSVKTLVDAQNNPQKLAFSLDALPQNYVYDPSKNTFVYIDYEPTEFDLPDEPRLSPTRLIHYALIKFGRERPDLFKEAYQMTRDFFPDASLDQFLQERPYTHFFQKNGGLEERRDGRRHALHTMIQSVIVKEDLVGMAIALTGSVTSEAVSRVTGVLNSLHNANIFHEGAFDHTHLKNIVDFLTFRVGNTDLERLKTILCDLV